MSQSTAPRLTPAVNATGLFNAVRGALDVVIPELFLDPLELDDQFTRMQDRFPADYALVATHADILFGPEFKDYGTRVTDIFREWEREGDSPSLPAFVAHAIERFNLDPSDAIIRAAVLSAFLAEYPNTLQYHGNLHYRKVLFHTIRLIATQRLIHGDGPEAFTPTEIGQLLTAACVHDLGHEGGDNMKDGVYTPGLMEQKALDIIRPYFDYLQLDRDVVGEMETMIFCTDITFFAGDNSPCIRMKKIFKLVCWGDDSEDVSMIMMGKLRRFEDNPKLLHMAMMLHEADIATSAGLSYEQTMQETINLMEERGVKTAGPRTILAFLREQLGESLYTQAAKQVFAVPMGEIIARAESDLEQGKTSFYQA